MTYPEEDTLKRQPLRTLLNTAAADRRAVVAPGVANALTARIVEDRGFDCAYASGAGIANWTLGVPDIGLTSRTDVLWELSRICAAVEIPIVADADTGYGNALGVVHTVRTFERAGVAGIQLEDQVDPKRCGHFAGKAVIPMAEMVAKIHAAVDARRDDALVIVARTDARAPEGLDSAIERAHAYQAAGADVLFVEGPHSAIEMAQICRDVPGLHITNIGDGARLPILTPVELGELGVTLVIYAHLAARAAIAAMDHALTELRRDGHSAAVEPIVADAARRNHLVGMDHWNRLSKRFGEIPT